MGLMSSFELMSSKDVAYHMTAYDWELFHCVHEVRPTYLVIGLLFGGAPAQVKLNFLLLLLLGCATVGTRLPLLWEAEPEKDHGEPGLVPQEV